MIGNTTAVLFSAARGIERVEVVDPVTVRILCGTPKADMSAQTLTILPKHAWGKVGPSAANTSPTRRTPTSRPSSGADSSRSRVSERASMSSW